jgi:hypothetical protein
MCSGSTSESIQPLSEKRDCVICGESLKLSAIYCNSCNKYQNRIRRVLENLSFSSLVTLIPIATLAYAFLKTQIVTSGSDVRAQAIHCKLDLIRAAVSNVGTNAAILSGGLLEQKSTTTNSLIQQRDLEIASEPPVSTLGPGEHKILIFRLTRNNSMQELQHSTSDNCANYVRIHVIGFGGELQDPNFSCACN